MPVAAQPPARVRSLRARLTAAAALAMAIALTVAAVLLVVRLSGGLLDGVDATARQRSADVAALARSGRLPAHVPSTSDDEIVQVLGPDGHVVADTRSGSPAPLPGVDEEVGTSARSVSGRALGGDADTYRVVRAEATGPTGPARIVVAEASDDVHDSVSRLVVLLAAGLPVVLAVLVGLTWLLVGQALHPVEVLRRQAAAISGSGVGQRVDVPSSAEELARLARTLNELLDRADGALDRERAFVADAAHELRTPLAAMLTRLDVRDRWPDDSSSDGELRRYTERLSRLVDDLLVLARVDARKRSLVDVDLDDVVLGELPDARRLASNRLPPVDVQPALRPVRVRGDTALLGRVVRNLLDNAIRHARSTVTVSLKAEASAPQPLGSEAVLVVTDDGAGIKPADTDRIFDRFTRLDEGRGRDTGGAGLGLAIVREVVHLHGGRIVVDPSGPGACFVVRLPLEPAPCG